MAMQTKTIKQKMKSVANIGKITKAMEMISVSKMKKAVAKRNASLTFAQESFAVLNNLQSHKNLSHPYLEIGAGKKVLIVAIASNKGLCGGYNMNVSKQVTLFKKENPELEIEMIAVGRQAQKIAHRNKINLLASFDDFSEYYSAAEVRGLLHTIFKYFDTGEYSDVYVAYTEFVSSLSFEARMAPFMPLNVEHLADSQKEKEARDFALYSFEPNEQEVLNTVVPAAVLMTVLYQYLLEGKASEHSSRVSAMRNASDNAKELGEELKINYNRARQAAITQEIAEIVGGSSAVS